MAKPIRLIAGLGNPGTDYAATRHNAGFRFVDALAREGGARFREERKFQGSLARLTAGDREVWLLKPSTFMNLSGRSVVALALYYKILPDEILVVHDELDLDPGQVRLKQGGGNAGHNGLKSITEQLTTPDFWRLRIGVGHPRRMGYEQAVFDFVLSAPGREDEEKIERVSEEGRRCLECFLSGDMAGAQRRLLPFSGKEEKKPGAPQAPRAKTDRRGPRLLVSRCLLGYKCRWDGEKRPSLLPELEALGWQKSDLVTFCPETEGGLPVPRPPAEIMGPGAGAGVLEKRAQVVTREGGDVTAQYLRGARKALKTASGLRPVAILMKERSPACGVCFVHDGSHTGKTVPGRGVAAELLSREGFTLVSDESPEAFPPRPATDEDAGADGKLH